jgi:cytochrome c peroxidase
MSTRSKKIRAYLVWNPNRHADEVVPQSYKEECKLGTNLNFDSLRLYTKSKTCCEVCHDKDYNKL